MKAVIFSKFGPPEVLQIKEIKKPAPKDNEVLIRVYATTVEKEDPMMRRTRGLNGFIKPRRQILGMELSGEIESVGRDVTKFKENDQVFGNAGMKLGTYAEYICLPETGALSLKPLNMSFTEAAAITNGALTALPYLRDLAKIQSGQTILINGASGTVGTAAVQLAKYYGAVVTGVCRTSNLEKVKSLGADYVIDYSKEDFTKSSDIYDIIFDVAGKSSFSLCKKILRKNGTYITTVPTLSLLFQLLTPFKHVGKKVKFAATGLRSPEKKVKDLNFLKDVIEAGMLKSVIDQDFTLDQVADAHRRIEAGQKNGTIVINVK
jgi:NADPH:quinone reductase-like Zn-dependent oxidoreductase